jgi:hypothetical protein
MKLNKMLGICSALLAAAFLVQLAVLVHQGPEEKWFASWVDRPTDIAAARNLAGQIVKGRVINIRRGRDLVVKVRGEPKNEDRVHVEIVTFALEGGYKGSRPKTVEVFHTGLSLLRVKGRKIPRPHKGVKGRVAKPPLLERRTVSLDEDPPYKVGQRYVLMLRGGPSVSTRGGRAVKTMALVSPAGRYRVTPRGTLVPVMRRGFAAKLRGKKLSALEVKLPKFKALKFKGWAPKLQQLKLQELRKLKKFNQLKGLEKQLLKRK